MKKLLLVAITCFAVKMANAQSVSFTDLLNLTSMSNTQAHDFMISKGFKQDGTQSFGGKVFDQYKSGRTPDKTEMMYVGQGSKTPNGNTKRDVSYTTIQNADLDNLLAQAKKSTLTLIFQGADVNKNIFRFDNSLFRATISVAFDKKSGAVDVSQKENAGN
jgi:hypothetical protein